MRVRSILCAAVAALALFAAGCGSEREAGTPVACLEGSEAYLRALDNAPGTVRLAGTPLEDCLTENQSGGELAEVGEAMIDAATTLNAKAREEQGGKATAALGYLIGAAERGAERTEGIHADLVRRLVVAARFAPGRETLSPAFIASYEEGFDAGRDGGWRLDS
jgi:hypothetical protein